MNRVCKRCRKKPVEPGRSLCPSCYQYYRDYRAKNHDKILERQRARREAIKRGELPLGSRRSWQGMDPKDEIDGYVQIARYIIKSQIRHYKSALRKYARGEIKESEVLAIEHEICTPYYAILTLQAVDLPALCKEMRHEAGVD